MPHDCIDLGVYDKPLGSGQARSRLPVAHITGFIRTLAENSGIGVTLRRHEWPFPMDSARGVLPSLQPLTEPERYSFLQEPQYQADGALLLVPDLTEVGPEVGHLLMRQENTLSHVFVCTAQKLPSRRSVRYKDVYRGSKTLPYAAVRTTSGMYGIPKASGALDAATNIDAERAGLISFHDVASLNVSTQARQRFAELLRLVHLQKSA